MFHMIKFHDASIDQGKGIVFRTKSEAARFAEALDRADVEAETVTLRAKSVALLVEALRQSGATESLVIRSNDRRRAFWGAVREVWF